MTAPPGGSRSPAQDADLPAAERIALESMAAAGNEYVKAHLERETDELKARRDRQGTLEAADLQGDIANLQAFYTTMSSLAVGELSGHGVLDVVPARALRAVEQRVGVEENPVEVRSFA